MTGRSGCRLLRSGSPRTKIVGQPRRRKGVGIIEGRLVPDCVRVPVGMPPKPSAPSSMGCPEGESALMILDEHAGLKRRFGDRRFWSEGCCVTAAGLSEATTAKRVREREARDIALDKLGAKEHEDPFKKK